MRHTVAFCVLLLGVAGCGDDSNNSADMSIPPDMAVPPDMSLNGVTCGSMTCGIGMDCCVTLNSTTGSTSASCIASGSACTGGASLACDGPEDCTASQFCCGTISFTGGLDPDAGAPVFNGGNSSCTGTCDFNFSQGPPSAVTSRLCHFNADCAGLSAFGQALDHCCSSAMAPGLHFCAAALIPGVTCQ